MASKPPKVYTIRNIDDPNNTDTSVQFSVGQGLEDLVGFSKTAKSIASTIRAINDAIQGVVKVIKDIISFISGATNLFQGIIEIGKSIVEDALALGGHVIIVHPWNQRNKVYKSLIYNGIKSKKDVPGDEYIFTRVSNWFEDCKDYVSASTTEPELLNLGIPQLTVQGAINEVIWACDNLKDPMRPKFTDRMYSCGIGIILNVTNPLDMTQFIDALKALFDFSEFDKIGQQLEKNYEKFKKQMDDRSSDFLSSMLDPEKGVYKQYQEEWGALGIRAEMETLASVEGGDELEKAEVRASRRKFPIKATPANVTSVKTDLGKILTTIGSRLIIGDSGPRWLGLRLDMIPILKELKEAIEFGIDAMLYFSSFVSDSIIDVLTIIVKKIEFIMDTLETIAKLLESVENLIGSFLAGGVWFFVIEPEVGGINHIKQDLKALAPLIPNSNMAGYSIMIFLTAGYPDYGKSNAYLKRLKDIMGDFDDTVEDVYGLRIFLDPSPTSSYAITDNAPTIAFNVRSTANFGGEGPAFKYRYSYRSYPKDDPTSFKLYNSGKKLQSQLIQLPVEDNKIYELEVRADLVNPTEYEERNFDIIFHTFTIFKRIELSVITSGAVVEIVGDNYYLHVPIAVTIYNFKYDTAISYNSGQTSSIDVTEYSISTDDDGIDYSDLSFDGSYLISFSNGRPVGIIDTVTAVQNQLTERSEFTVDSSTLIDLINQAEEDEESEFNIEVNPLPPDEEITIPATFPYDETDTSAFCIASLIQRYLDKNKTCEIIFPSSKSTLILYDCLNVLQSMKVHMVYNEGKYDPDQSDAKSYRIPTSDYYTALSTTTSPVSIELTGFIVGYYVIRLQLYWIPGTVRYQKAGGVIPQLFDIYLHVVDGETTCFLVES